MAIHPQQPEMSLEEFLAWEATQPTKHEFADGEIYAMAGASRAHGTIALNLAALVRPAIRKTGCQAYIADMKVVPPGQRAVRYPDLVMTCDPRDLDDEQITRFPKLIVEVLSRNTASIDRGQKFEEYRRIPTLEEYVLIDSAQVLIEVLRRGDDVWTFTEYGPGATFRLQSIALDVRVTDLYEDIELGRLEQGVIDTINRNRG
jgi:Uma2 family endonuclease